jgi:hypothetical protein
MFASWSQYKWTADPTIILPYTACWSRKVNGVETMHLKRQQNGSYGEIQVTPQHLKEYNDLLPDIEKNVRTIFGTIPNSVDAIARMSQGWGLFVTTEEPKRAVTIPTLHLFYYSAKDNRKDDQIVKDINSRLHATLYLPQEYGNGMAIIRYCQPNTHATLPTQYCAEAALGPYNKTYKETCYVRRWFKAETDTQTDLDDVLAHWQTISEPPIHISAFNTCAMTGVSPLTIYFSSSVYRGPQTLKMQYLRLDLNGRHWTAVDLKDIEDLMDPTKVIKTAEGDKSNHPSTILGYEVSPTSILHKIYTIKPTGIHPAIQQALDLYGPQKGFICFEVPRETSLLILNSTAGHSTTAMVKPKIRTITVSYDGTMQDYLMTDFPYMMKAGYSPSRGFIKFISSKHVGSGFHVSFYVTTEACDNSFRIVQDDIHHEYRATSADTTSMYNSQMNVVALSILTDTERCKAIANRDRNAIDKAANFCYAVTSTRDPNYNEHQLADALVTLAHQRNKAISPTPQEDKSTKRLRALDTAINKLGLYRRFISLKQNTLKTIPVHLAYYVLKHFGKWTGLTTIAWAIKDSTHRTDIANLLSRAKIVPYPLLCLILKIGFVVLATYIMSKLFDKIKSVAPINKITHPELLIEKAVTETRKSLGCRICKGRSDRCIYCDYTEHKPVTHYITPLKLVCSTIGLPIAAPVLHTAKDLAQLLITGASDEYEPPQIAHRHNRFPQVMDDTLTSTHTTLEHLNNVSSYTLPGFQTIDQMIEEIRERPGKNYDLKNTTSFYPIYEDLRMNYIEPNLKSAMTAIFTRQGHYDTKPDVYYLKSIDYFSNDTKYLIQAALTTPLMTQEEFIADTEPKKKLKYKDSLLMFNETPRLSNTYTVFPKNYEMAATTKRGRLICGPKKNTIGTGSYMGRLLIEVHKQAYKLELEQSIEYANLPHDRKQIPFIQGMSTSQIRTALEKCFRTFKRLVIFTLDIKGYDGSQSKELLSTDNALHEAIFRLVAARAGYSKAHTDALYEHATNPTAILKLYDRNPRHHYKIKKQTEAILAAVFVFKQSVYSGNSYLTTLGNTNRQIKMVRKIIKKAGLTQYVYPFASGDDMAIACEYDHKDDFERALRAAYATEGATGKYGSGMILKEICISETSATFLSKKLEIFGSGSNLVVEFYRDLKRFVHTGGSGKALPITNPMINYMNTSQLESQCYGDPAMLAHIAYRKRTMPHHIPNKRAWSIYYNDTDVLLKSKLHATTTQRDMFACSTRDPVYRLMKAGAHSHEICLPEGITRLCAAC